MAGGGVKPSTVYGETDDFAFNIVKDPVHIHDARAPGVRVPGPGRPPTAVGGR